MTTCDICAEPLNKSTRKHVVCNGCELVQCAKCVKKYLTQTDMKDDPHCMGCRIRWDRAYIISALNKSWLDGDLRDHRKIVLLDRQRSQIPAIQDWAVARKDLQLTESKLAEIRQQEQQEIYKVQQRFKHIRSPLVLEHHKLNNIVRKKTSQERKTFVHKCAADDCEGFLSSAWKCGVCKNYTCNECGKIKEEGHTCLEDDKATFALISKECKPCPNCATQIFKIEGCDQMWCTQCHIPFSWNTGRRINGNIHNPHYFAWMREQNADQMPRQPGDIPCGGVPHAFDIHGHRSLRYREKMLLENLLRYRNHVDDIEINTNTVNRLRQETDHDLLGKFIVNEISERDFAQKLIINDKKRAFQDEIRGVMETFVTVITEQIQGHMRNQSWERDWTPTLSFLQYIMDSVTKINKVYSYNQNKFLLEIQKVLEAAQKVQKKNTERGHNNPETEEERLAAQRMLHGRRFRYYA